jgi:hypothetical protein
MESQIPDDAAHDGALDVGAAGHALPPRRSLVEGATVLKALRFISMMGRSTHYSSPPRGGG